jgi:hypothetical protein
MIERSPGASATSSSRPPVPVAHQAAEESVLFNFSDRPTEGIGVMARDLATVKPMALTMAAIVAIAQKRP